MTDAVSASTRRSRDFQAAFATAAETAEAILSKQVSAVELLTTMFARLDRYNPAINAVVWPLRERAMARARQADRALADGKPCGPLHGVPITIKEAFAYEGSPNTWGLPALKDVKSARTATAVDRLESAGAIVIGKTNVPVMLGDYQSDNPIYGTTNNPWDVARTAGGSTGGGAAALAAGLGCLTLGSDLAGSIRVPAHFCGVYGHKPTLGLVSTEGFQPGAWDGSPGVPMDLAVVGPLARSAGDLALAINTLGGPDRDAAHAWSWRMPAPRQRRLEDFRIGYVLDDPFAPVSSDVGALYHAATDALARAGARMERGWPSGIDPQEELSTYRYLLFALVNSDVGKEQRETLRTRFEKNPGDLPAAAAVEPHGRWLQETKRRLAFRSIWQKYFESHDVFLCPAAFCAAFPHDRTQPMEKRVIETPDGARPYLDLGLWSTSALLAGLPATVAPVGLTDGDLPVGIQIVGPMWEDGTPIEFAALLSDGVGGFVEPPDFRNGR
jgi:amidase